MIITFGTQKGGSGKTTLAIAFANYLTPITERTTHVYDFDFQKSFYNKWLDDEEFNNRFEKIYEVTLIDDDKPISLDEIIAMKMDDDVHIFDLAGTLDNKYTDLLVYSDIIVIPFEYSDVSMKSTLVFNNVLNLIEFQGDKVFVRSKFDMGFNYPNQEIMDETISHFGTLLQNSIYKRNCLQVMNTRKLTSDQKKAVKPTLTELIETINDKLQITL